MVEDGEARIRELERKTAVVKGDIERIKEDLEEEKRTKKEILDQLIEIKEAQNELQTLRRAIRWSIGTVIAASGVIASVWRAIISHGG